MWQPIIELRAKEIFLYDAEWYIDLWYAWPLFWPIILLGII